MKSSSCVETLKRARDPWRHPQDAKPRWEIDWFDFVERRQEVLMIRIVTMLAAAVLISVLGSTADAKMVMQAFPVLAGAGPHDVYPATDGTVWFTAQSAGKLGTSIRGPASRT
jgi:hypothetical protein